MKRTGAVVLLSAAAAGAVIGYLLDYALTASGRATFTPAVTLPILLIVLGVFVVAMAWPIRQATRGTSTARVNPFRAVRVAMLAKASSILGAALGGVGLGLLGFLLTRPVVPSLGSLGPLIATVVCGAVLVAAGLLAEHLCTIRKDDDDEQPGGSDPGLPDAGVTPSHH
ncbi:DUF3180 domain-containing protein [Microbacterium terricola]|uniref:DUF3180 domain-containing protein n=1 Tax=Microbacterium terricola TaxID=344163 RepID=A0ABM8DVC6_9MICO|nr:DUF3180 domain-containing protein [Microbacterium terricola]UYK39707.1 DUF3180 domain-containing protein [Microbacterium terricola]BDV29549.1 hypothetical protein Microterr_02090 [Microbacterium terricola]